MFCRYLQHLNPEVVARNVSFFKGPKENTLDDFWLMIWQEDVKQVIMLTNLMEGTKVNNNMKSFNIHVISIIIILKTYFSIKHL